MSSDKTKTGRGKRPKQPEVTRIDTEIPDEDEFGGATQITAAPDFADLLPPPDSDESPSASVHDELTREVMVPEAFWRDRGGGDDEAKKGDFELAADTDRNRSDDDADGDTMADVDETGLAELGDAFPDKETGTHEVHSDFSDLEDPPVTETDPQNALARAIEREETASETRPEKPKQPPVWTEPRFMFPGIGLLGGAMIVGLYVWAVTPDDIAPFDTETTAQETVVAEPDSHKAEEKDADEGGTGEKEKSDAAATDGSRSDLISPKTDDSTKEKAPEPAEKEAAAEEAPSKDAAAEESKRSDRQPGTSRSGKKPKAGMGLLSLLSSPKTDVFEGGKKIGSTPLRDFNMKPGKHNLVLKSSKFGLSKALTITITAGGAVQKRISFRKGKVAVLVKPWADVMYRGKKLGTTPMPPFTMYEGTYTLKLVNPEHGEKTIKVTVQSGKTAKVIHTF